MMISPADFFEALNARGVSFYAGVPDSLLSSFCAYVDDNIEVPKHLIAANEGNAVALAAGFHMATGKIGAVYLQNSGLGNVINPLTSLADKEVYRIPMLLVIGWRGEPGVKDEPQHVKQGRITEEQLNLLEIPYSVLDNESNIDEVLNLVFTALSDTGAPVALLVRKDAFKKYKTRKNCTVMSTMPREVALSRIIETLDTSDVVISTTGKTSREVYEIRALRGEAQHDFLTVGGMGHTSSIALGVAIGQPDKRVICIDGDGSALMHLGAMAIIGNVKPPNLIHILLNNASHESVGGQPTVADQLDFRALALACGYTAYFMADTEQSINATFELIAEIAGPVLFEIRIATGSRDDLGRPKSTAENNKFSFMEHIRG